MLPFGNLFTACAGAHVHENSLLSGVVYAQVPPGSGSLRLTDPRIAASRTAVHGSDFALSPTVGDLVVFAPWIEHRAETTRCSGPDVRVSFSFNLHGCWTATENIRGVLPVSAAPAGAGHQ